MADAIHFFEFQQSTRNLCTTYPCIILIFMLTKCPNLSLKNFAIQNNFYTIHRGLCAPYISTTIRGHFEMAYLRIGNCRTSPMLLSHWQLISMCFNFQENQESCGSYKVVHYGKNRWFFIIIHSKENMKLRGDRHPEAQLNWNIHLWWNKSIFLWFAGYANKFKVYIKPDMNNLICTL